MGLPSGSPQHHAGRFELDDYPQQTGAGKWKGGRVRYQKDWLGEPRASGYSSVVGAAAHSAGGEIPVSSDALSFC